MKRLLVAGALLVSVLAAPASAGGDYRFDATVKCKRHLTERAAERVRLIEYDTSGESLGLVYRCRRSFQEGAVGDHRYSAIVKCIHWLAEDAAAHIKLIDYDTSGKRLRLAYRCRSGY